MLRRKRGSSLRRYDILKMESPTSHMSWLLGCVVYGHDMRGWRASVMMFMHAVARDARSEPLLPCHDVYVAACDALCKPPQSTHRHPPCLRDGMLAIFGTAAVSLDLVLGRFTCFVMGDRMSVTRLDRGASGRQTSGTDKSQVSWKMCARSDDGKGGGARERLEKRHVRGAHVDELRPRLGGGYGLLTDGRSKSVGGA